MKSTMNLLTVLLVGMLAFCGMATALSVTLEEVKINGDTVLDSGTNYVFNFEKNQDLTVKVRVTANEDIDDVQIEAALRGYDHNDLMEDISDVFDMESGVTYTKTLNIPLRIRMDQDRYKLRIRFDDRDGNTTQFDYDLEIDTKRHLLYIKDIILSPENEVRSGRALLASVRVQNYGLKDEEGIKVKVSIPDLGVSATDYLDDLEKEGDDDDQTTTEELYLRIPDTAQTGTYTLRVQLTYDEGDEIEVQEMSIRVLSECDAPGASCGIVSPEEKQKTVIEVPSGSQNAVQAGSEIVYALTISNQGTASRVYEISVSGASWLKSRVEPSSVVIIDSKGTKAVSVYASASKDAPVGEQTFTITVKEGNKILKEIPMKINVSAAAKTSTTWDKLKRGLEVALVIIVVLLVILGLIIGFNKLKGEEPEEKTDGETYY